LATASISKTPVFSLPATDAWTASRRWPRPIYIPTIWTAWMLLPKAEYENLSSTFWRNVESLLLDWAISHIDGHKNQLMLSNW
jgi:hypothetical protein